MPGRLEPDEELRNFLRANLTDLNSANRGGEYGTNWVFSGWPRPEITTKNTYPLVFIHALTESASIIGVGDNMTYGDVTFQIDVLVNREVGVLQVTHTDENLGDISNSPRLAFTDVPTTTTGITNIKHDGTAFTTVTKKTNVAAFTTPASLAAGTVEWSFETGDLNFSSADLTSYSGQAITSTYYRVVEGEFAAMWIAREVVRKVRVNWRTDTTIGELIEPELISGPRIIPYDPSDGVIRCMLEYKFKRFNTGEQL